jgi:hypothetical protein
MPNWFCCVVDCNAGQKKLKRLEKYPWMQGVTFHPLPRSNSKKLRPIRAKWLQMIRREATFKANKTTRLCSRHFVERPTKENPYPTPTLFPYNNWGKSLLQIFISIMISSLYSSGQGNTPSRPLNVLGRRKSQMETELSPLTKMVEQSHESANIDHDDHDAEDVINIFIGPDTPVPECDSEVTIGEQEICFKFPS